VECRLRRAGYPSGEKALKHMSIHQGSAGHKLVNSKFAKRRQDPEKLKDYIKQAAAGPSALVLSRQACQFGRPNGTPCLLLLRDFKESIGDAVRPGW
jgi:hypothetical protein